MEAQADRIDETFRRIVEHVTRMSHYVERVVELHVGLTYPAGEAPHLLDPDEVLNGR